MKIHVYLNGLCIELLIIKRTKKIIEAQNAHYTYKGAYKKNNDENIIIHGNGKLYHDKVLLRDGLWENGNFKNGKIEKYNFLILKTFLKTKCFNIFFLEIFKKKD